MRSARRPGWQPARRTAPRGRATEARLHPPSSPRCSPASSRRRRGPRHRRPGRGRPGRNRPGDRGAPRGARIARDHLAAVVVGEVRGRHRARLSVEVLADVQVGAVIARLPPLALIAGPAEVLDRPVPSGSTRRLTSSQVPQPTSPAQTSFVPGRTSIRKGFRRP